MQDASTRQNLLCKQCRLVLTMKLRRKKLPAFLKSRKQKPAATQSLPYGIPTLEIQAVGEMKMTKM